MLGGYTFLAEALGITKSMNITFFPIVIVTVLIERFSVMIAEEGVRNTLKSLVGTLIISILTYGLYQIQSLQIFVFTHPEILLSILGVLILIGKYQGYRLSELIRFRSLIKQKKKYDTQGT